MERLIIENFAGIKSMTLDLNSINILIGPQGTGKSVTVKLLYFFKNFFSEVVKSIETEDSKRELDRSQKEKFNNFFPKESWPKGDFRIDYFLENTNISISRSDNRLVFDYSDNIKVFLNKGRKIFSEEKKKISENPKYESFTTKRKRFDKINKCLSDEISPISTFNQYFVPAGRSFFANIQKSIFSFLSDNHSLDPFLIEFGSFYETLKRIYEDIIRDRKDKEFDEIVNQILNSQYHRDKDKDFLVHGDTRKVNLANASSGQQETLPLIVILKALNVMNFGNGSVLYIEEPEAHLFPTAQKRIVQLLARTFNNHKSNFQIIVTTHSPYILSSFNNLVQAGRIALTSADSVEQLDKVVAKSEQLNPDLLCAYSLSNGKGELMIDKDSSLISQTILDDVSNEISIEFGKLLDIEFK